MLTPFQTAKVELLAHGLTVTPEAEAFINERDRALAEQAGLLTGRSRPLTLADYASTSGITLELEEDVWVNAPIALHNANMVRDPRYELRVENERLFLHRPLGGVEIAARFVPIPAYFNQRNAHRELYTSYVNSHADRARISPIHGCAMRCKFCNIPYEEKYHAQPQLRLIEAAARALDDPIQPASHLLISGGTPGLLHYDYLRQVYRTVIAAFEGVDVDVMMAPVSEIVDLEELAAAGVNELSLNLEIWDRDRAAYIAPEKARTDRATLLGFIAAAVGRLGRNKVRSILMVGLETPESTLEGVEALAAVGCVPVLSPFRPDPATDLRDAPAPDVETMVRVYNEAAEIAGRYGLKLGPHCIPCSHNTLTFADGSQDYRYHDRRPYTI